MTTSDTQPAQRAGGDIPAAANWLGAAGMLPFVAGAIGSHVETGLIAPHALNALLIYAAVIVSFMAGCQWGGWVAGAAPGFAWPRLLASVAPPLLAWPALLLPAPSALLLLAGSFVAVYVVDVLWLLAGWWPRWYVKLRTALTAAVLGSLAFAYVGLLG